MAVVGVLGDIIFTVSDATARTLSNLNLSGSARYAVHQRHATDALSEFVGLDPDKLKFDMTLSAYMGVNPQAELRRIEKYERGGVTLPLVIGDTAYGKFRWIITSHSMKAQYHDGHGNVTHAVLTLQLQEYI